MDSNFSVGAGVSLAGFAIGLKAGGTIGVVNSGVGGVIGNSTDSCSEIDGKGASDLAGDSGKVDDTPDDADRESRGDEEVSDELGAR
jgi:hypothetical protein